MTELETKIAKAAQTYYSNGKSELTDEEFDALVESLRATNPDSPILKSIGWGYDVYADSTPGQKFKHRYGTAGSLEKCRTWEEIKPQFKDSNIDISLKLDGLSVVLYYRKSYLYQALTRGDGEIGIDITDKIRMIPCMADKLANDAVFYGAVRGEIVMSFENFEKYKAMHPEAKNPRNTAVGIINSKDNTEDLKYLDVVVYSVIADANYASDCYYMHNIRYWLKNNFKKTAPALTFKVLNKSNYLSELMNIKDNWSDIYPSDGLVLTSMDVLNESGVLKQDSIAFKFKADTAQTEVLEVEWNMSKTGYAVPRVKFKPIELEGTTVQYATGYNAKYIADNKISVGTIVEIEKRGCIIPNINAVIAVKGDCELPKFCPHCNTELQWEGVHLACKHPDCNNSTLQDTMIWTNELAPIGGLAETMKVNFFNKLFDEVPNVEKLMESIINKTYIAFGMRCEKIQIQKFYDMLIMLKDRNEIPLKSAIKALNIPRFGDVNANRLAQYPNYVHELLNIALDGSCADGIHAAILESNLIRDIGKANTESLFANLDKITRLKFIESRIDWSSPKVSSESKGKVAITGKLSVKRSDFEQELRDAGYTPAEISKDTKFLITDTPDSSSSKNKKADAWGIVKITEEEFRQTYMN